MLHTDLSNNKAHGGANKSSEHLHVKSESSNESAQFYQLLSAVFGGLGGEVQFYSEKVQVTTREPEQIERFIEASGGGEIFASVMTSTGDVAGRAFSFDTEEAAYEFVDHAGLPWLAFTFRGEVRGLLYADGTPNFEPCAEETDVFPLPGFGDWGLTEASAEKLAALQEESVDAETLQAEPVVEEESVTEESTTIEVKSAPEPEDAGPVMVNDAEIIGEMPQHVLDLKMVLGFGRSRDDKVWPAKAITFTDLLTILTKHPVGSKNGTAFLQGSAAGNIRKKMSITALYMMGLDIDCGISMDFALTKIRECKLAAVVYTTNSHMGTDTFVLEGSYNQFCKKNKLSQDGVDRASMVQFLIKERHWLPEIAETIELPVDGATHPEEGKGYNLTHAPMPKFRIIFPLDAPFVIAKQTVSQAGAIDLWKAKLLGLAKTLTLPIDISCTDPSRLFYFPRHKKGAPFRTVVLSGEALDFQSIIAVPTKGDAPITDNEFAEAAKGLAAGTAYMVGDFSLKCWAAKRAKTFDIVRLFREVAPGKIRNDQGNDKIEIECPFDAFHSNAGDASDRACWIESANADRGFGIGCQHNTCKERDRLEFIAQACDNGWFTADDLKSDSFTVFGLDQEAEAAEVPQNSGRIFDSPKEAVDALNKIAAVMRVGAKTLYLVCEEEGDELTFETKAAAEDWFSNWLVPQKDAKGKIKMVPAFNIWRKSTERRQYNRVVFRPDGDKNPAHYNIWTGFKVAPKAGDWRLLRRHMYEVLCSSDPALFEYLLAWFSQMFQEPAVKPGVALVVFSKKKGTGKSILMNPLRRILGLGIHATTLSSSKSLTSQFNTHMERSLLVCGEEVIWAGNREAIGPLKAAITEPTTRLEKKNIDAVEIDNFSRFYLVSNEDRCIPAEGDDERRFFALRAGTQHRKDIPYFKAILKQLGEGGTEALLHDLLNFDHERVELRLPPRTEALAAQTEANLAAPKKWWMSVLQDGCFFDASGNQSELDEGLGDAGGPGSSRCRLRRLQRHDQDVWHGSGDALRHRNLPWRDGSCLEA